MKRILTNKEYRFIKELKELMTKYNAVISTDAQGKIEIVVNEDNELNPEKPDVPLNKNDAFQKVQKRHVQEKR